jgi:tRNA G18 (ribose-2'-O)-methylase SpoU
MSRLVRERCDALVALPMRGTVGSLNAAASLAAVLYAYVVPTRSGV